MSYSMDFISLIRIAVPVGIAVGVIVPSIICTAGAIIEHMRLRRKMRKGEKPKCAR